VVRRTFKVSIVTITSPQGLHVLLTAAPAAASGVSAAAAAAGGGGGNNLQQLQQQQQQQQVHDLQQQLTSVLGPTQVLSESVLAAAAAAEVSLTQQLKLFSPKVWNAACQQVVRGKPIDLVVVSERHDCNGGGVYLGAGGGAEGKSWEVFSLQTAWAGA
jgi:hypothetical protein